MKSYITVIFAFLVVAIAVPTPLWPNSFSASFTDTRDAEKQAHGRWWYDVTLQAEKVAEERDHMGKAMRREYYRLFNRSERFVIEISEEKAKCYKFPLEGKMKVPTFDAFTYIGEESVGVHHLDHWQHNDTDVVADYWDETVGNAPYKTQSKLATATLARTIESIRLGPQSTSIFDIDNHWGDLCGKLEVSKDNAGGDCPQADCAVKLASCGLSCSCDYPVCECCADCAACLGDLYLTCCGCFNLCP
eukprot:CAMPEP_0168509378 /NCGR_PEP_ID=MMETSP0405-20121227/736_1 /TAXON_ID=498012 /ORGANISM="Trichosphaerium sp, Strain Am-I-7 wt" /LENGTH=246 /DNA_ID=CAMNT_0008526817 /DNA_START=17 /DNA_END=760 /DNA_ORIENTATION=+